MRVLLLAGAMLVVFSGSVMAQYDASGRKIQEEKVVTPLSLADVLPQINQSKVLKSAEYVTARTLLGRKIKNDQMKAVGEVRDVYVESNGDVNFLSANFNRLQLSEAVILDRQEDGVSGLKEGYQIALTDAGIKEHFPLFKKRTDEKKEELKSRSITKLIGAEISTEKGQTFAKLKEVLFDYKGESASIGYIVINGGGFKNKPVAVPFGVLSVQETGGRPEIVISNSDLDEILKFLSAK